MTVLVGGVGQLYQGDLDLGRHAAEALAREQLGAGVVVENLHYGAVAVVQRLQDLQPDALVLIGAVQRGRAPGTLERRRIDGVDLPPEELQRAVREALTGYVTLDLVVEVAFALDALPARTVAIEIEPVLVEPAERLSAEAERLLGDVVRLAGHEARRAAALALADELRSLGGADPALPEPLDRLEPGVRRGPAGYLGSMENEHGDERAEEEGEVARTTEQDDELTAAHSLSQRENRAKKPYARPRQPAQDPPSRD